MAKYCNQNQAKQHLEIPVMDDLYAGLFLDVVWTIEETDSKVNRESVVGGLDFQATAIKDLTEEELAELFSKAQDLEGQNKDLEQ